MLAGRGISPLASGPFRRFLEPHEHRAARCIVDITNQPIPPLALAIGEVVTTHRFGLTREAVRQFGGVAGHHAASHSAMRSIA